MSVKNKIQAIVKVPLLVILISGLLCVMTGCYSSESDTPYFPVSKGETGMEALATGTLILENGYLRISPTYSDNNYLIIWPSGYTLGTKDDEVGIFDEDGQLVAAIGDTISLAGGEMKSICNLWLIGVFLPFDCQGPYWVSGNVTKK